MAILNGLPGHIAQAVGGFPAIWLGEGGGDTDDDRLSDTGKWRRADRSAPHVLIVEDELFIAWHLENVVEAMNHRVCAMTARGEEAVARVAELAPDLVLMDVTLAGTMDGIEAARRITQAERIPIVFITAYADRQTLQRIEDAVPGSAVLQKPINSEALQRAISAALARSAN